MLLPRKLDSLRSYYVNAPGNTCCYLRGIQAVATAIRACIHARIHAAQIQGQFLLQV